MSENKNTQYGILFIVFVVIMAVVAVLNNKISEELDSHSADRLPLAPTQSHAVEEVKASTADAQSMLQDENMIASMGSSPLAQDLSRPQSSAQEQVEPIYELPIRELELPQ